MREAPCVPQRGGTCLTGRHYFRYGITHANRGHLPTQEITLARMLKSFGYATGHFGKWHLGTLDPNYSGKRGRNPARNYAPPWERDYDASFATEYAVPTWDPTIDINNRTGKRLDRPWASPYYENGKLATENLEGCDSRVLMDRAIPFIEQAVENGEQFLTTIWFHAPHSPVVAGPGISRNVFRIQRRGAALLRLYHRHRRSGGAVVSRIGSMGRSRQHHDLVLFGQWPRRTHGSKWPPPGINRRLARAQTVSI